MSHHQLPARQPSLSDIEEDEKEDFYSTPSGPSRAATPPPGDSQVAMAGALARGTTDLTDVAREEVPIEDLSPEERMDRLYARMNNLVAIFERNQMCAFELYRVLKEQEDARKRRDEEDRDRDDGDGGWDQGIYGRMERG